MKRLMSREMLRELIDLVEPHKYDHPELYKYLMITWTACRYDSTLYACNVTGSIMLQKHLSEFEDEIIRFYEKEMAAMRKEPAFWQNQLVEEPICKALVQNWEAIRDEVLSLKETHPKWFAKYPKFKIEDPETQQIVRMYDNDWTITALSRLSENYEAENNRAEKTGGSSLEKLVKRYRSRLLPTLHNIVDQPDNNGILTNIFVSILSPGAIIRPHQGYSKDYMRIHMGLVCDPKCKLTVGDETRTWEPGKLLAFKDGGPYYHSVVHNGMDDRYILSFDLKLDYLENYIKIS
jgi:aspartyl/asparaginyl beta-hydroxylase (cupin superfamily)